VARRLAELKQAKHSTLALAGTAVMAAALGALLPFRIGARFDFMSGDSLLSAGVGLATMILIGLFIGKIVQDRYRIAESEQRFRRAMYDSAIGVSIVGLDGSIIETNPAFAAMLGYTKSELETLTFCDITHPDDLHIGSDTMAGVRSGAIDTYRFEKRYVRSDGSPVWTLLSGSAIRDADNGRPLYLVSQIEDIDARKKAEARIAEAETRWNFALASAGQGVWDFDQRKGGTTYSAAWVRMLGYEEGELDGDPDRWLTMIHPDDLPVVKDADRAHLAGETEFFEAEFRMRHRDGRWIWILDRGKAIERDDDGKLVRAIGSLTDITRRKEAEERLARSAALLADEKERLKITLQSIGDAVICTDAEGRVSFMNPVAEKLTGVGGGDALGLPLDRVYCAVDEESGHKIDLALAPGVGHHPIEQNSRAMLVRADRTRCSIRQVVSPIVNDHGEFGGSVIVFQDFTDARALQRQLAYAAAHDALTGLANRSSFIRRMEDMADAVRAGAPGHQFMFIDLDYFKAVNDTGGHAAGDALLKQVAETIRGALAPDDLVARLGGDEFAVVLNSASAGDAEATARAVIQAVRMLDFQWNGQKHRIGASIGLAPFGPGCGKVDEIIAQADAACYAAKAAGRGCALALPSPPSVGQQPSKRSAAAGG
jgi:diguanylate cyclase (GGDEF)-like protein/PAS domain S-box-containing protein